MLDYLPPRMKGALLHLNINLLYEMRVRADKPMRVNYGGSFVYLGDSGVVSQAGMAIVPTGKEVEASVFRTPCRDARRRFTKNVFPTA